MIICVGGAVLDRKYRLIEPVVMATSNPAEGFRSFGGVGRNICENLARLGADVAFVSVVGDDENGRTICEHLTRPAQTLAGSRTQSKDQPQNMSLCSSQTTSWLSALPTWRFSSASPKPSLNQQSQTSSRTIGFSLIATFPPKPSNGLLNNVW
jgi:hypothetical protein